MSLVEQIRRADRAYQEERERAEGEYLNDAFDSILVDVARLFKVTRAMVMGRAKSAVICLARAYAIQRARDELGWTLPAIGSRIGRHHTSVLDALRPHRRAAVRSFLKAP
jgi:chromosomal replication initiation ATPase DnaA